MSKYVELVDQLVEKATTLQELQVEMQEIVMAKDQEATTVDQLEVAEDIRDGVVVTLDIDFDNDNSRVITLVEDKGDEVAEAVSLSIEDFNTINQFLGRYNEVIFRFHNHLESQKAEAEEEAE